MGRFLLNVNKIILLQGLQMIKILTDQSGILYFIPYLSDSFDRWTSGKQELQLKISSHTLIVHRMLTKNRQRTIRI